MVESFHRENSRGGRESSMDGVLDFLTLFKKDQQLNKKQFFSTKSKKQH